LGDPALFSHRPAGDYAPLNEEDEDLVWFWAASSTSQDHNHPLDGEDDEDVALELDSPRQVSTPKVNEAPVVPVAAQGNPAKAVMGFKHPSAAAAAAAAHFGIQRTVALRPLHIPMPMEPAIALNITCTSPGLVLRYSWEPTSPRSPP
jgi:hypothetical protein